MKENRYSIKDLENLTHIKAHTIRIWEQRYNILQPKRTATNIRYYDDSDLRKILNVNSLYSNGLKISKIASLTEQDLKNEVEKLLLTVSTESSDFVQELINRVMKLDESGIIELLDNQYRKIGLQDLFETHLIPCFIRIGELWQLNTISIGHEHFFTMIVRNFIVSKVNSLPVNEKSKRSALLFLHTEEEHEISLLIFFYIFRSKGFRCVYLGQNMPLTDFKIIFEQVNPEMVVTNFVKHIEKEQFKGVLDELYSFLPPERVVIGGSQAIANEDLIHKKTTLIKSGRDINKLFV